MAKKEKLQKLASQLFLTLPTSIPMFLLAVALFWKNLAKILKSILWYCASILPKSGMEEVEAIVARKLPENKRSNFMKSFEEECTEKGISIGIAEGKSIGIAEGISIGDAKIVAIAQTLLSEGLPAQKVADVTKLPLDHVLNLWPSNK